MHAKDVYKLKSNDKESIKDFVKNFKSFGGDTLRAKKELNFLFLSQDITYNILYHNLIAKEFSNNLDSLNSKSNYHFNKAIELSKNHKDEAFEVWTYTNYIEYLYFYRDIERLIPYLLDMMNMVKKKDAAKLIQPCKMYKLAGWIFQTLDERQESINYLNLALNLAQNDNKEKAAILNALGMIYFKEKKIGQASYYFNETLKSAIQAQDSIRYAKVLGSIAEVEIYKKNYDKATELIQKDIEYSLQYKDEQNAMYAYNLLAKVQLLNNNKEQAKIALAEAEKIATTKSYYNSFEYELTELKLQLIEGENLKDEELRLRRRLVELARIIEKTDGDEALKRINWKLQSNKYQVKIDQANKQAKITQYVIIAVVILLFVILLIFGYIYLKNIKNVKFIDINAQETERQRIAGDLHDNIINKLTVIRLKSVLKHDPKEIDELLQIAIDDSRRLSHNLLPPMVDERTLEDIVSDILTSWKIKFKVNFIVSNPNHIQFDSHIKLHLIRIEQELLQNIYKHAQATEVNLKLFIHEKHLQFIMIDNGIGFDGQNDKNGLGLKNINSRAQQLQATYSFKTNKPENGTVFTLTYYY